MVSQNQPERRERRRNNQTTPPAVHLTNPDSNGQAQRVPGEILDISEAGIKIQARTALVRGVEYGLETSTSLKALRARVVWCRSVPGGLFQAGMNFLGRETPAAEPTSTGEAEDLYEILQVNPKATADTIHRVYRILAQRHHPDNHDTGNETLFRRLTQAYRTLSEPGPRAAYDLVREQSLRTRVRLFSSLETTHGKESERRKRAGVLNALYARRVQDPANPALSVFDFEDLLGVPRDHLEFTLWYLKERSYITRSDNNRFQITISGVGLAESMELQGQAAEAIRSDRLLPSG